jgi:hypothetical protein
MKAVDTLYSSLKVIVDNKSKELEEWEQKDPGAIDCPILECEIDDATKIMAAILSDLQEDQKVTEIRDVYLQTTSGSIYDAVRKYSKEEGLEI